MSNEQLIKSAQIWFVAIILACGIWAVAGKAGMTDQGQNSNQNSNSNSNSNSSSRNANRSQNQNSSNRNSSTGGAAGTQTGMGNLSAQDRDFLMDAAMGGMMEVELGRMATQQGMSEAVKQFGQRMVDDHSKANQELMSLAQSKGITLPTTMDDKHHKDMQKLSAMSGADFDRAYSKMMQSDHKKDVSEFEKQSTRGTDPDLKAFAAKTLPTLQEHLQMANALTPGGGNMGDSKNMNSNRNSNKNSNRNGNSNNSNRP
jgi:putative membrane protein